MPFSDDSLEASLKDNWHSKFLISLLVASILVVILIVLYNTVNPCFWVTLASFRRMTIILPEIDYHLLRLVLAHPSDGHRQVRLI